jgi:hypothetical protein
VCDLYGELTSLHAFGTLALHLHVQFRLCMNFGWLVIICETYVMVCDVVEN